MNRIIIDEGLKGASLENDTLKVDIKQDGDYLITDFSKKYVININNCNINILSILENCFNTDIKLNINSSSVVYSLISYNAMDQNILVNLNNESSKIEIYNSILSINRQKCDINILHNSKNTESNVYNCAATMGDGSVIFNVVSKVFKGMKNSKVNQDSKIISLNSSCDNKINPILLIDEYDTLAKHSAFIGKFKEEEVFYMQTRGLRKKQAYDLILKGFLIGMLKISDERKEELIKKYNNWR